MTALCTRTIIRIDVDKALSAAEGMTPHLISRLERFVLTVTPCKGGARFRNEIAKDPCSLIAILADEFVATRDFAVQCGLDTATGLYHMDRAHLLRHAVRLVRTRSFMRRYWPDFAEALAEN